MDSERFDPGALWPALRRSTESALAAGALHPLVTRRERIEDGGVRFVVRALESLQRKRATAGQAPGNPFLPYDPAMFVAEVSDTHVALLNKFNVIEHHLLIVTRRFEDQDRPLTLEDFEALWACMAGFDGLGFYNGGVEAGASQSHKHLQMVPLPLAPGDATAPVEPLLAGADATPRRVDALPFPHAVARIDGFSAGPVREAARGSLDLFEAMTRSLATGGRPYNLLVTRRWMMLVPRAREHFDSISVNALGFAGSLFVRDDRELDLVRRTGPMSLLRAVAEGP